MFELNILVRFIPKKVKDEIKDCVIDTLIEVLPDEKWRKVVCSFRADGTFQDAFIAAIERVVTRFAEEYKHKKLVETVTNSTSFSDLPSIKKALRTVVTDPSSYPESERKIIYQSFADVIPSIPAERVELAVQFFMRCLAEEVINIPQLFLLYQIQPQKATLEQACEIVVTLHDLDFGHFYKASSSESQNQSF
jgi:hypothetical protein